MEPRKLWEPSSTDTNIDSFRRWINQKRQLNLLRYADLHAWSTNVATAEYFWVDLFEYLRLKPNSVPQQCFSETPKAMYPPPVFFPDVHLNFTEHIFNNRSEQPAIYAVNEGVQEIVEISWDQLHTRVKVFADALIQSEVQKDDVVVAIVSNNVEAIVACLATLSIGAIFSSSSPDMGAEGILARLDQIEPKIVIFQSSAVYNNKKIPLLDKARRCHEKLRNNAKYQEMIIISDHDDLDEGMIGWERFCGRAIGRQLEYEQVPFNHPGFIVFSSGTTGAPKCIVHSAGGVLMKVKADYLLQMNVRPDDVIYQYTTTGWIMWVILLGGLSFQGTIVLYDGSPLVPDPMVTLRMIEKLRITLFGTSARFLSDLMASNAHPYDSIDMSSLRTVSSTGSVLQANVCEWFYDRGFPAHVHLVSVSGGTDIAGSFVSGDATSPVYAGEIQRPSLGMAIDVLDSEAEQAVSVASTGRPGELVCRRPIPSQPTHFWKDDDGNQYRKSYFERYGPEVWHQGDLVSQSPLSAGFTMLGRSDGVLNPSGVRFGSAEIYNAISHMRDLEETICVGQRRPFDSDETVILFVKMRQGKNLTPKLAHEIKATIRTKLTPRHVPKYIFEVPEIPYTINGKKIELIVKKIVSGQKVKPSGAVTNPVSLKSYERFVKPENLDIWGNTSLAKL